MKDVDYVLGEVQALVNKNMKIKENSQLINGLGTGEEMAGINTYASEFVTAGVSKVISPNLVDLVNKIGLQIMVDMMGGAAMTNFIANPIDIQPLKEAKETSGRYIFEAWALGQNPSIAGAPYVANPLMTVDTLLAGDFNMGTLFVFDDLLVEMVRTEDDEIKRMVTIFAYKRENLRVKDVDKKAFVKVSSIATALGEINANPEV
jgi:HK97 family phage major capsid protein